MSLGDHDTEQEAARAFDRAVLHKSGRDGKTNFPISDYEDEIEQLQGKWGCAVHRRVWRNGGR